MIKKILFLSILTTSCGSESDIDIPENVSELETTTKQRSGGTFSYNYTVDQNLINVISASQTMQTFAGNTKVLMYEADETNVKTSGHPNVRFFGSGSRENRPYIYYKKRLISVNGKNGLNAGFGQGYTGTMRVRWTVASASVMRATSGTQFLGIGLHANLMPANGKTQSAAVYAYCGRKIILRSNSWKGSSSRSWQDASIQTFNQSFDASSCNEELSVQAYLFGSEIHLEGVSWNFLR